jgi:hypothetical protein
LSGVTSKTAVEGLGQAGIGAADEEIDAHHLRAVERVVGFGFDEVDA